MSNKYRVFLVRLFFIVFSLSFLTILYSLFFRHVVPNSDAANVLLQAQDILRGNIFLKRWLVPSDNFYTLDILYYLLPVKIFGLEPSLMLWMPAFFYSLLILTIVLIVFKLNDGINKYIGLFILWPFLIVPSQFQMNSIGMSPCHVLTVLYVLLAFWFLRSPLEKHHARWGFILLFLANIGDPLSYYIGNLPLLLGSFAGTVKNKESIANIKISLLAWLLCVMTMKIIEIFGFHVERVPLRFVTFQYFPQNVLNYINGLLSSFTANFFGQDLGQISTVVTLFCFSILVVGSIQAYRFMKRRIILKRVPDAKDRFLLLLISAVFVDIFACFFSNLYKGEYSNRYLIPTLVFLPIVFSIILPERIKYKRGFVAFFGIFALVFTLNSSISVFKSSATQDESMSQLIAYLESHHFAYGYATYWNANIMTVNSKGRIIFQAVESIPENNNLISPFMSFSNLNEHIVSPVYILIYQDNDPNNVNYQNVVGTFGTPLKSLTFGSRHLFIWDKDISGKLIMKK